MSTAYSGDGITFPDNSVQATAPRVGMVNRLINSDMRIDQRNAGASATAINVYTVDRWHYQASQASKVTWQQNAGAVTPPVGFTDYLGLTSSSAYSVLAGDYFRFYQVIEGYNIADLGWGTASAKAITLSFQVYSSLTGTFGGSLSTGGAQSYPFTYSIPTANTWTTISLTIAGATGGTWGSTNNAGIYVGFSLGAGATFSGTAGAWASANYVSATGATSVVGTSGATFYVTGVQLEKGSTATDFEYVDYGRQLQMCQRYFQKLGAGTGNSRIISTYGSGVAQSMATWIFKTQMRATPTFANPNGLQNLIDTTTVDLVTIVRNGANAAAIIGTDSTASAEL